MATFYQSVWDQRSSVLVAVGDKDVQVRWIWVLRSSTAAEDKWGSRFSVPRVLVETMELMGRHLQPGLKPISTGDQFHIAP